jgi:VWFA-related protein
MVKAASVLFILVFSFSAVAQTGGSRTRAAATPVPPSIKNDTQPSNAGRKPPSLTDPNVKPQADSAQQNIPKGKTDDDVISVETNLVTTPVSVLDRSGRFIPGLRKKDFKLFENGVPQKITYFQSEEQPFTVILMIDVSPSTKYHIDDIHYAALTFVNQLRPTDKVMVVAFDQRVRVLTEEPTSEKQKLYAAIYKANFGSGTSLYDAVDAIANLDILQFPGRKAVVIFTDGVDTTSRRANYQSTISTVEEIDALFYPIHYDTQQKNSGGAPLASSLPGIQLPPGVVLPPEVLAQLQANVIRAGRGQSAVEYERGRTYLESLATNTGGRMFEAESLTNLEASFSGVAEELRRQYSIGYYPDSGEPGERRKIKIEILAKPNVIVRAKSSYVIKQPAPAAAVVSGN